jgi:hypothetical protein
MVEKKGMRELSISEERLKLNSLRFMLSFKKW